MSEDLEQLLAQLESADGRRLRAAGHLMTVVERDPAIAVQLAVLAPGLGDGIQLLKAGLLEIGDFLLVNKADTPGAEQLYEELMIAVEHGAIVRRGRPASANGSCAAKPRVMLVSAAQSTGIEELAAALDSTFPVASP